MRGKDDAQDDVRKNLRVIVKICNVSTFKINYIMFRKIFTIFFILMYKIILDKYAFAAG